MNKFQLLGFTLLELLVALLIMAILTSLAYPSYIAHSIKIRRTEGQIALLNLASRMEQFYQQNNNYLGATLAKVGMNSVTVHGYYVLAIADATAATYNIQAIPAGTQINDTQCATLTFNHLGLKGQSGSGTSKDCW